MFINQLIHMTKLILPLASLIFIWPMAPQPMASRNDIAVGKPAPDFQARTLDGKLLRLSELRGRVVLLDFMASWCGICLASLPEIKEVYGQFDRAKFEIVSVSLDGGETTDTTLRDLERMLAERRVNWPVVFDDTGWENAIARSYHVSRLPVHVIIDRDGIIRLVAEGGGKKEMREVRSVIQRLMRGASR